MSQEQDILYHLHNVGELTAIEALNRYGCFRLASRINDLRRDCHKIETRKVKNGKKSYAAYFIIKDKEPEPQPAPSKFNIDNIKKGFSETIKELFGIKNEEPLQNA